MDKGLKHINRPRLSLAAGRQLYAMIAEAAKTCRYYADVCHFGYTSRDWVELDALRELQAAGLVRRVGLAGDWKFTTQGANVVTDRGRLCAERGGG